ncbi:NADH dehydrogenase [Apodemus speciosus]|uniref:NADH dehydrogenase n=1 Tax=Apodemus speciosus TaxID=105296 RepID=A0ABQ0FD34_APOSI
MSVNGAVWGRVRSRLRAFPEHLAACGAEASAYGKCVQASTAPGGRLSKDLCVREFEALRSCFAAAMKASHDGASPSPAQHTTEPLNHRVQATSAKKTMMRDS